MNSDITIHTVAWEERKNDLLSVRREVFVVEQQVPEEIEIDEHDPVSLHFLAVDPVGSPVGTARLLPEGRVGRMAVQREWRRHGVGSQLLRAIIRTARERGDTGLYLHAQVHSIPFYASLGFAVRGDEFEEAGIPHREMALSLTSPLISSDPEEKRRR
jgi:predicted GNAT family N-acyltransferase